MTANYVLLCHLYTVHVNRYSVIVIDIYTYICHLHMHNFIIIIPFSFRIMPSSLLCSFVPHYFHFNHSCIIAAARSLFFGENIQFKIVFFLFFYQKGKSSRIRFYFRNKVRFHGRKKQSLGVEKVCSFSIALLKCPYALINLSMFGSSQWGKWLNLTLFWCLSKGKLSLLRA